MMCPMKRPVTLGAAVVLSGAALVGCAAAEPEPSRAEKAWQNCIEVLTAYNGDFTDDDVTPEKICTNQRATWDDFEGEWIDDIARLVTFYDLTLGDVEVYTE